MFLLFGNGQRVRIEKMPESSVTANENDLLEIRTGAALFQQPEQALDRNIHHIVGAFLTGRAMQNVSDTSHGRVHNSSVRNTSADHLDALIRLQKAVMTQRANCRIRVVLQNAVNEMAANFSRGSGNQNALHGRGHSNH